MRPFSVFTPAFSKSNDAVFGTRPSANRISSAETEIVLPLCSNETVFNFPLRLASISFVSVKTWIPSRRKTFSISTAASGSNSFKRCSLRWMSVTLTPNRAKNCANSHAIAPPPSMMSDFGNRVERQRIVAREIANFVQRGQGRRRDDRAGGDDEMFRCNFSRVPRTLSLSPLCGERVAGGRERGC